MRILIATASRHGATREIGQWLGASILREMSTDDSTTTVDVRDARDVDSIAEYDAAIIGSGVYMGRWLRDARSLIAREQAELESMPVWLFSSGPVDGSTPAKTQPKETKADWAIEHRVFGGKLDRAGLSRFERAVVRLINVSDGDSRSRAEVLAWAVVISSRLTLSAPNAPEASRPDSTPRTSERS
ncbi:flavodoxin domain-containing protein [Rhodococcus sp. ARC_M12]|uniref:flavodoxin domain-containing protein n=1 Tax=unclassified Rhodococcus (in: high G+C Gram-positive bacteria) TaxID=192944 RepID=UPI001FB2775A|nr:MULTISPECIES: flavodoxin domain-containing protein [unclassified Rhodococcus (in: high G+C Gram-positive bacteria)]MCJ0891982.1 flavodoxin domain-containing protein [Rhodococcus sp. ARC_M5]MCJ0980139.1 flavodoxin domain-containing protein [Rhodococcus sp. ARC_M12]